MTDRQLASFLIGFSLMFMAHYFLEPTWGAKEARPNSLRMIFNYSVGTAGICISFLYMHPAMWVDLLISVSGAALATVLSHSRDYMAKHYKGDQADGLIEDSQKKA
jgi:hypothetical protein